MKMKCLFSFNLAALIFIVSFCFVGRLVESEREYFSITDRPDESSTATSASTTKNDVLRELFASLLGLRENNYENDASAGNKGRANAPQYVQNLYDRIVLDSEGDQVSIARRRRSVNVGNYEFGSAEGASKSSDGAVTIQAIARDNQLTTGNTDGVGYLLQFNLERWWISNNEIQLAELALAVDYSRLVAPPASYSVFAYAVDDDPATRVLRSRLLVSAGTLGVLDTFGNDFVKLKVTDAVKRMLVDNRRSIIFEIFVAYKQRNNGQGIDAEFEGTDRNLTHAEIRDLLHLTSRGVRQSLLVVYSSIADGIGETKARPLRRRRSASSSAIMATQNLDNDAECRLHEWWVELADLFREVIIKPKGFYANFCGGICRFPMYDEKRWNASGNANLRNAYNAFWRQRKKNSVSNEQQAVPDAKCVAHSTSPITVLYKVGENFIIRQLSSIVVNSCGCA